MSVMSIVPHRATDMDDFTPPPPPSGPPGVPPPLPPPARDVPEGYRAISPTLSADTMVQSAHYSADAPARASSRRGGFGFLAQHTVKSDSDGHTMLRKQKLRREELRQNELRASRQAPPVLPEPNHSTTNLPHFGGDRPDSIAIATNTNKANNFSRPHAMPSSNSSPYLSAINGSSPRRDTFAAGGVQKNGEYVDTRSRVQSSSSGGGININSPRRTRRRKDPTPFK